MNIRIQNRSSKIIFRIQWTACVLVSIACLLCGCTVPVLRPDRSTQQQDELAAVGQWLEKDCSFELSYEYMNLAVNGFSQKTTQTFAADGSWAMITQRQMWDHTTDYESRENAEFYYRYEDSQLVCYSRIDENAPQHFELTQIDLKELNDSKAYLVGSSGLLPDYLQELSVSSVNDRTVFSFQLPVEEVLQDSTLLSVYVNNVFSLCGEEYKSEYNAKILCLFETDSQTFQPISLTYDFSQLKPYVLSNGAQSGEYAFNTDFMTMTYFFNYHLPETTDIPLSMIP